MSTTAKAGKVRVVRNEMLEAGPPTTAMRRRMAVTDDMAVVELTIAPGIVPGWHHHGTRTVYVYVQSGILRVEFGPDGRERMEMAAGDFYVVEPETVHRETNIGEEDVVIIGFATGTGPTVINVDGPEKP